MVSQASVCEQSGRFPCLMEEEVFWLAVVAGIETAGSGSWWMVPLFSYIFSLCLLIHLLINLYFVCLYCLSVSSLYSSWPFTSIHQQPSASLWDWQHIAQRLLFLLLPFIPPPPPPPNPKLTSAFFSQSVWKFYHSCIYFLCWEREGEREREGGREREREGEREKGRGERERERGVVGGGGG